VLLGVASVPLDCSCVLLWIDTVVFY
jgi:hypothetical protein